MAVGDGDVGGEGIWSIVRQAVGGGGIRVGGIKNSSGVGGIKNSPVDIGSSQSTYQGLIGSSASLAFGGGAGFGGPPFSSQYLFARRMVSGEGLTIGSRLQGGDGLAKNIEGFETGDPFTVGDGGVEYQ